LAKGRATSEAAAPDVAADGVGRWIGAAPVGSQRASSSARISSCRR
jgi:hypothetical protein